MSADLFYVKLADGDVHRVSLDQLDDAFQAGHIDGGTMVLADGSDKWTTLGELAGMDDDEDAEGVAPVQVVPQNDPRVHAAAPYVHSQSYVPPQASRPAPVAQPWQAPQPWQATPSATARSSYPAPSPYSQSPRTPYGQSMPAARPQPMVPNSVRPVSVDLGDFDPDLQFARRGGGGKRVAGVLAVLAVVGAAAGVATVRPPFAQPLLNKIGLRAHSASVVAVAAPPPPAPVELPPPAQEPTPPPAPPQPVAGASSVAPGNDSPLSPHFTDRASPQPKDDPVKPDTKHASKGRVRVSQPASHGSSAKAKSNGVFTTGGNKYDPLNSSI
jgi:hypothetical protein